MIQTALSQQPGCVEDPSYVMYASVFGINDRNEICLIGVEEPAKYIRLGTIGRYCQIGCGYVCVCGYVVYVHRMRGKQCVNEV